MKILKSQLKQIIKEEYDRVVSEAEGEPEDGPEGEEFGIFTGKRSWPLERKGFKSKAEAEEYLANLRKESPYSSKSFDPGGRYGLEVRALPKAPAPPPPASKEEVAPLLDQFSKMLAKHDWYYQYADDHSYWSAGQAQADKISDMRRQLERMGAGEEANQMYKDAATKAFPNGR
jgi:hypothetical protein